MKILGIILAVVLDIIPAGDVFMRQLHKRDSILIADQIQYGISLSDNQKVDLQNAAGIALPDFKEVSNDTLALVRGWQMDTIGKKNPTIEASIVLAPFEEGRYVLPDIPLAVMRKDRVDTLVFKGMEIDVKSMPVDTATFVPHDIKDQIRYPVTAREVIEVGSVAIAIIAAVVLLVLLVIRLFRKREGKVDAPKDPAHIVALRQLEKYRSDKFWAPEKQKEFYSGITDALKEYIDARFGVDAPEMTTAELFDAIKADKALTPELYTELKALFETADFVKFAKAVATDEENAGALPLAVRFVTSTYQAEIESEAESGKEAAHQ